MKIEDKIAILSECLSRHLKKLREIGGLHSISAIEQSDDNGYKCEIAWSLNTSGSATIIKKSKDEAGDDIASTLVKILTDEAESVRKFAERREKDANEIDYALVSVAEKV
jgi:hypothetical protein